MRTSAKMGLRIWNLLLDPYDHEQLADNWAKVDAHDHSPGRGVLIPTEGIANEAIAFPLIAASVFPEVSAEGGALELVAAEEKALAGGPTLTVPATGTYEIGLTLTGQSKVATIAGMTGYVRVNGTPEYRLFYYQVTGLNDLVQTTNFVRAELQESDELTVGCQSINSGPVIFTDGRISILRVA
jgi:hypothetical protein